ncbi:MAG: hypothetical protein NVSMB38_04660 [Ktedonobacteraceae bacterium]
MPNTLDKIYALAERLSPQDQQQVLDLIEELAQAHQESSSKSKLPPGTPGSALTRFTLSQEDAEAMERAIKDEQARTNQETLPTSKLPPGTSKEALLNLHFSMSPEDIALMEEAIEDCERIEPDEDWLSA